MSALSDDAPRPRLCHLIKWPHFDGYGFHLQAERFKSGQYIGKVDADSPAEAAGLKMGDRIVEVNGVNITHENHKQVVERIKLVPNETKLLVVDKDTDEWYKTNKFVVKGTQENVEVIKTPPPPRHDGDYSADEEEEKSAVAAVEAATEAEEEKQRLEEAQLQPEETETVVEEAITNGNHSRKSSLSQSHHSSQNESAKSSPRSDKKEIASDIAETISNKSNKSNKSKSSGHSRASSGSTKSLDKTSASSTPPPPLIPPQPQPSPKSEAPLRSNSSNGTPNSNNHLDSPPPSSRPYSMPSGNGAALNLNMTAQEMRAMLASKKKYDPKKDSMDLKRKHEIVQGM